MSWICLILLLLDFFPPTIEQSSTISTLCDDETCTNSSLSNDSLTDYDDDSLKTFLNFSTSKGFPSRGTPEPSVDSDARKNPISLSPGGNACPCDLIPSTCDINCCCDLDCSPDQVSVFSHCHNYNQATKLYDSRYCYRTDFIKKNRTDFILDRLADNLFCISHDNLPPFYSSITTIEVKNRKNFEEILQSKEKDDTGPLSSRWQQPETSHVHQVTVPHVHGHLLRKYEDKLVKTVDIPASGFTGVCSSRRSLRYLEEFHSLCLQGDLSNSNEFLFPETFNFSLISTSFFMKNNSFRDSQCPRNACVPLELIFCDNSSTCNRTIPLKASCQGNVCFNVVKRVTYVFYHNGTKGILKARIFLETGNVSRSYHQHFQVQYQWIDGVQGILKRSGNPGYVVGRPIIIGSSSTLNLTKSDILDQIVINETRSVMTVPLRGKDGECLEEELVVGFGEDLMSRCSISLPTRDFSSKSCVQLQEKILGKLFGDTLVNISQVEQYKVHVSKASNTSGNATQWVQVLLNKIPRNNANAEVSGDRIICARVLRSLRIDVMFSVLPKIDDEEHYKIAGVGVTLGDVNNLQWGKCRGEGCVDWLRAEVITYVVFHDISAPSMYYYAGGPNLDISLPYDFFYPFLSGGTYSGAQDLEIRRFYQYSFWIFLYFIT